MAVDKLFYNSHRFHLNLVVACLVVASCMLFQETQSVAGGTSAKVCDFPGIAVIFGQRNEIICTGVIVEDKLVVSVKCMLIFVHAIKRTPYEINSGRYKWVYPQNTPYSGTNRGDGTLAMNLNNDFRSEIGNNASICDKTQAVFYDGSEPLDSGSCQLAGFGSDTNAGAKYSPKGLKAANIFKSTSAPCCKVIFDTLTPREQGVGLVGSGTPYNCVTAHGSPCGISDVGAPVMCTTASGKRVTIGLVATSPCVQNGLFLIHDVTGSSSKTKFGLKVRQ